MSRKFFTDVLFYLSSLENSDLKNSVIDEIDDFAVPGRQGIEVEYISSTKKSGKPVIIDEVKKLLQKKFEKGNRLILSTRDGRLRINPEEVYISFKQRPKVGKGGSVKTAIQEEGSAFILTQVLKKNKKFESAKDIINDTETYKGLEKIFGSTYKGKIKEWVHSYFEHQKAFFKKFQPSQWDVFEHGGQDFMTFIKEQCQIVKAVTASGRLTNVGKYETWNPSDIWAVKDQRVTRTIIDKAIQKDGTATLTELNSVLYDLIDQKKLIGLSLKKIKDNKTAKFKYVNISPKDIEFADVEKIEMKDIKIEIDTRKSDKDGMIQGAYVTFADYTTYIIRTPGDKFSNLKYESVIKGSGGKGGAAPVDLVEDLIQSRTRKKTFTNKHQEYPQTIEEFIDDNRDYKKMYNSLKKYIRGTTSYDQFESMIRSMFESDSAKRRAIAQSKLMQLNFFSDVLNVKSEFWTDLLYMSLKVGERFAPHGKLS
jgi:hypothetical protein|tara:strand:- start:33 stop:1475 length:1443 start_codon:yes stop_codon:yes gene_type:complete